MPPFPPRLCAQAPTRRAARRRPTAQQSLHAVGAALSVGTLLCALPPPPSLPSSSPHFHSLRPADVKASLYSSPLFRSGSLRICPGIASQAAERDSGVQALLNPPLLLSSVRPPLRPSSYTTE